MLWLYILGGSTGGRGTFYCTKTFPTMQSSKFKVHLNNPRGMLHGIETENKHSHKLSQKENTHIQLGTKNNK